MILTIRPSRVIMRILTSSPTFTTMSRRPFFSRVFESGLVQRYSSIEIVLKSLAFRLVKKKSGLFSFIVGGQATRDPVWKFLATLIVFDYHSSAALLQEPCTLLFHIAIAENCAYFHVVLLSTFFGRLLVVTHAFEGATAPAGSSVPLPFTEWSACIRV